ncbi:MAG: nuclear transport factor 2 family protein [Dehalococcoidia bacterium]
MPLSVEDQLSIQQLYARYNHAIDSGQAESWAACFTADGVFESPQGSFTGTEGLIGFAKGFHAQMKGKARHWNTNLVLDGQGGSATGSCYLVLNMGSDPGKPPAAAASGIYRDQLAKQGGDWKFTRRAVAID